MIGRCSDLKNIEGIYRYLGISRTNNVWSWGVETEAFVILQVWSDENIKGSKRFFVLRDYQTTYKEDYASNGLSERIEHLEQIRNGKPCYFLVTYPNKQELALGNRVIAYPSQHSFLVSNGVFVEEENGDITLEYNDRISFFDFKKRYSSD